MKPPRMELVEARYVELPSTPDDRGNLPAFVHLNGERATALTLNVN